MNAHERVERDHTYQNVALWERELKDAGWTRHPKKLRNVYVSPSGAMYRGPYGAWKAMKAGVS